MFRANLLASEQRIKNAVLLAAVDASEEIKRGGDESIRSGGNFGRRWTDAFFVSPQRTSFGARITLGFRREMWFATIYEFGGVIRPRLPSLQHSSPLLWIPLSHTGVKVRARDYPGRLIRVNRKSGRPLLIDAKTKEPIYFGIPSVVMRKRFYIRLAAHAVMRRFGEIYRRAFRRANRKAPPTIRSRT